MDRNLAVRINELRIENNLSKMELASKTGIPQATIARYELGKSLPNSERIIVLCSFFGVSADYLLGLEDNSDLQTKTRKRGRTKKESE